MQKKRPFLQPDEGKPYALAEHQRRERLRLEAAGQFARGDTISETARDLRVTEGRGAQAAPKWWRR